MFKYQYKIKKRGFSLLELLITLAIIGILAAIIYPSYSFYIVKIRRNNAAIALTDIAASMEEYYAVNNKYDGATLSNLQIDDSGFKDFYQINITAGSNSYSLKADPIGVQKEEDELCQALVLDQSGKKSITGMGGASDCWGL
jgi:type IV pilus assembly protein PilE